MHPGCIRGASEVRPWCVRGASPSPGCVRGASVVRRGCFGGASLSGVRRGCFEGDSLPSITGGGGPIADGLDEPSICSDGTSMPGGSSAMVFEAIMLPGGEAKIS